MAGSVTVLHTVLLSAADPMSHYKHDNRIYADTKIPSVYDLISYFLNYSSSEVFTIIHQVLISGVIGNIGLELHNTYF